MRICGPDDEFVLWTFHRSAPPLSRLCSRKGGLDMRMFQRRYLVVFAVVGLAAAFASVAVASVTPLQISSDPYTNTTSQHKTEVEPDTFASGSTIVSTFQVGRIFGEELPSGLVLAE